MNSFDKETKSLKREILALKSYSQKVAEQLRTTRVVVPVEITLTESSGLRGSQYAQITLTPTVPATPLIAPSVDIVDLEMRQLYLEGGIQADGSFLYEFAVQTSDNPSDTAGKKLSYNLVFTSTGNLTAEVEYKDYGS